MLTCVPIVLSACSAVSFFACAALTADVATLFAFTALFFSILAVSSAVTAAAFSCFVPVAVIAINSCSLILTFSMARLRRCSAAARSFVAAAISNSACSIVSRNAVVLTATSSRNAMTSAATASVIYPFANACCTSALALASLIPSNDFICVASAAHASALSVRIMANDANSAALYAPTTPISTVSASPTFL